MEVYVYISVLSRMTIERAHECNRVSRNKLKCLPLLVRALLSIHMWQTEWKYILRKLYVAFEERYVQNKKILGILYYSWSHIVYMYV